MTGRSVSPVVMPEPVLRVEGVSKRFGGVQALKTIDFEARAGEVHGLVGENGAGKSTLVKILSGIHSADAGTIRVHGKRLALARPHDATAAGISAIHQEPSMFDELTVAENIFVAAQPKSPVLGLVDWPRMITDSTLLLEELGTEIDPRSELGHLSVAERHIVSIARALSTDSSIIVLDEPTAGALAFGDRADFRNNRQAAGARESNHIHFAQAGRSLQDL